jgi:Protein of unknown function (DUF3761)
MNKKDFLGAFAAPLLMFALAMPGHADSPNPTTCKDGTTSAATGRGACSGHGGVQKGAKAAPTTTAPAAAPAPSGAVSQSAPAATTAAKSTPSASKSAPAAAAASSDPTGATAKCKDGTYSKSQHHSGTCSHHGGVAEWLKAQ